MYIINADSGHTNSHWLSKLKNKNKKSLSIEKVSSCKAVIYRIE